MVCDVASICVVRTLVVSQVYTMVLTPIGDTLTNVARLSCDDRATVARYIFKIRPKFLNKSHKCLFIIRDFTYSCTVHVYHPDILRVQFTGLRYVNKRNDIHEPNICM